MLVLSAAQVSNWSSEADNIRINKYKCLKTQMGVKSEKESQRKDSFAQEVLDLQLSV